MDVILCITSDYLYPNDVKKMYKLYGNNQFWKRQIRLNYKSIQKYKKYPLFDVVLSESVEQKQLRFLNKSICRLQIIQYLDDGAREYTDECFKYLKDMKLTHLSFSHCYITGKGLKYIKHMPIRYLELNDLNLYADDLKYLKHMPIEHLSMSHNGLYGYDLHHLINLPIKYLDLYSSGLTDSAIPTLSQMQLEHLNIKWCHFSPEGIKQILNLNIDCVEYGK